MIDNIWTNYEYDWLKLFIDKDSENFKPKWIGIETINRVEYNQFFEFGWSELSFLIDYVYKIIAHLETEEFFNSIKINADNHYLKKTYILRYIASAINRLISSFDLIRDINNENNTELSSDKILPKEIFKYSDAYEYFTSEIAKCNEKWDLIRKILLLIHCHVNIDICKNLLLSDENSDFNFDGKLTTFKEVSERLCEVGSKYPPMLFILDNIFLKKLENLIGIISKDYYEHIKDKFINEYPSLVFKQRTVYIDIQNVIDYTLINLIVSANNQLRNQNTNLNEEFNKWKDEGNRIFSDRCINYLTLGGPDLGKLNSLLFPNFGECFPSSLNEVEEIIRIYTLNLFAKIDKNDLSENEFKPDEWYYMYYSNTVLFFKLPDNMSVPLTDSRTRIIIADSFANYPLFTWMLLTSNNNDKNKLSFWTNSYYFNAFRHLYNLKFDSNSLENKLVNWMLDSSKIVIGQEITYGLLNILFPGIPKMATRATSSLIGGVISNWINWNNNSDKNEG